MSTEREISEFEQAAQKMVDLGNRLLDDDEEADSWEVASGLLAGAVHFCCTRASPREIWPMIQMTKSIPQNCA